MAEMQKNTEMREIAWLICSHSQSPTSASHLLNLAGLLATEPVKCSLCGQGPMIQSRARLSVGNTFETKQAIYLYSIYPSIHISTYLSSIYP